MATATPDYEDGYADAPLLPKQDVEAAITADEKHQAARKQRMLLISFLFMVVIGLGNKVFQKLQTLPMNNYPYFLNLLTTWIYIPLSFAYIWPMIRWGSLITKEQRDIPWYKWCIMGSLDGLAGVMQSFAVNYIPSGGLITLILQSAIPISMIITKLMLKTKYQYHNYTGAGIVLVGLVIVLLPKFIHPDAPPADGPHVSNTAVIVWCAVLIVSCVPMTLSSVYKEKSLGEVEIDVVYMNGWVAIYQFLFSLSVAIPSAYASALRPSQLPDNMWGGLRCLVGKDTLVSDKCHDAPLFVSLYIMFNVLYNILIIMILKYGSANLLWLAMTIMVPLAVGAFALPFLPDPQTFDVYNGIGLVIIMSGLVIYRFWNLIMKAINWIRDRISGGRRELR
eukprot:TRINITY_DN12810_c0_g1_i1.p1 TRINITY_DN12810_c0_g1~~TRINITY_DN12810_c0_g1_i1.p1  ORF type:complete len:393 (-),score=95.34 TRINITY_DN12810_c0_g1_i1:103-1281(-)